MDDVSAVAAKYAITEMLYRYCRGLDRMDHRLSCSVWHPDGTAFYSGLYEGSGAGFVDWVFELHRGMAGHSHQVTNVLIELGPDGCHAASEAYVTVRLRTANPGGEPVDIVGSGRYLDRWSYRDGRWAIEHRQYVSDLTTTVQVPAPGGQGRITPAGAVRRADARRDRDDPSYSYLHDAD